MRTLKSNAGRLIERILPKAEAEARGNCTPYCVNRWLSIRTCRLCCWTPDCVWKCGPWEEC
jgi:hypothetical protein